MNKQNNKNNKVHKPLDSPEYWLPKNSNSKSNYLCTTVEELWGKHIKLFDGIDTLCRPPFPHKLIKSKDVPSTNLAPMGIVPFFYFDFKE